MPRYMLLIYTPSEGLPPDDPANQLERWASYTEGLRDAGLLIASDQLERTHAATTVRVRDGETQILDGPFAETKEYLAGFYMLDAADLDTALEHAARVPHVHVGSVEVRPIVERSQP